MLETTHGRAKIMPMLRPLEQVQAAGVVSDFIAASRMLIKRHRRRMMVVPISDFFFPEGFDARLPLLRHHRHEVFCLKVQNERDRRRTIRDDAELAWVESGSTRRVTVGPAEAAAYESAVTG